MRDEKVEPLVWGIADQFARWATRAAVNSGMPQGVSKSQSAVNTRIDLIDFDRIFDRSLGEFDHYEFDRWHAESVNKLMDDQPVLGYARAAKHIAIYLKVTCYLADFGRDGLKDVMHPPFDGILLNSLSQDPSWAFRSNLRLTDINESVHYLLIISNMREIADKHGCTLFEVEQFWSPE